MATLLVRWSRSIGLMIVVTFVKVEDSRTTFSTMLKIRSCVVTLVWVIWASAPLSTIVLSVSTDHCTL